MIGAIGIDLVEVDRIQAAAEKWGDKFLQRIFTEQETGYCLARSDSYGSLAVRFAAKEAVAKATGLEMSGMRWRDVEVVNDKRGRPQVVLHGKARKMVGEKEVLLSMSHAGKYAIAVAVLKGGH
ncbi:MAG TPA: holo-[acyl-carrier-protein] synthase [Candidatus Latescibacteria bacterium]|nr:holo-[acyl-carrier-protein] synthase [Candidatus Latescibacterota bacterium]